jgi:hypothetical protein
MPTRPRRSLSDAISGSKPRPSSSTTSRSRPGASVEHDADPSRLRVAQRVRDGLLRDAEEIRLHAPRAGGLRTRPSRARPGRRSTRTGRPRAAQCRDEARRDPAQAAADCAARRCRPPGVVGRPTQLRGARRSRGIFARSARAAEGRASETSASAPSRRGARVRSRGARFPGDRRACGRGLETLALRRQLPEELRVLDRDGRRSGERACEPKVLRGRTRWARPARPNRARRSCRRKGAALPIQLCSKSGFTRLPHRSMRWMSGMTSPSPRAETLRRERVRAGIEGGAEGGEDLQRTVPGERSRRLRSREPPRRPSRARCRTPSVRRDARASRSALRRGRGPASSPRRADRIVSATSRAFALGAVGVLELGVRSLQRRTGRGARLRRV